MFRTAIAGSLPKPAWLAETKKLWPQWHGEGAELADAKRDATLLCIKMVRSDQAEARARVDSARRSFRSGSHRI